MQRISIFNTFITPHNASHPIEKHSPARIRTEVTAFLHKVPKGCMIVRYTTGLCIYKANTQPTL